MAYDLSYMENSTDFLDIIVGTSTIASSSSYLIGNLILLSFFLVFLVFSVRFQFEEVLITDSFIVTLLSLMFWSAGLVSEMSPAICLVFLTISLVFYFIKK